MASPKLFIFDADGSLRDSSGALYGGLAGGFASVDQPYPFEPRQVWNLHGVGKYSSQKKLAEALYTISLLDKDIKGILKSPDAEEKLDLLLEQNLNDADKARIEKICGMCGEFFNSPAAGHLVQVHPFASGAIDILKNKNCSVALLTNSSMETLKRDFKKIGLDKFSCIVAKEDLEKCKPSGEGIETIMSKTGFSPEETLHVGDAASDIRAAKNAGCLSAAILCGTGLRHHLEREKPDHIFENIWELSNHFKNIKE